MLKSKYYIELQSKFVQNENNILIFVNQN